MANYLARLPAPQIDNAQIDFEPINAGINALGARYRQDQQRADQLEEQTYNRGRDAKQDARVQRQDDAQLKQTWGKQAQAVAMRAKTDPAGAAMAWKQILARHPNPGGVPPEYMDPTRGPQLVMAESGLYNDPRDDQLVDLKLQEARGSIANNDLQRQKTQYELDDRRASAGQGKIMDGDKPLIRVTPDGRATPIYTPQPTNGGFKDVKDRANVEEGLRKEVFSTNKDYPVIRDAARKIEAIAQQPSPGADIALIFSFMKILDPGSVVRETEFATAQNAAGVPDQLRNVFNRILSGERLNDTQRADFIQQARTLSAKQTEQYTKSIGQYRGVAERLNVDPRNVILDSDLEAPPPSQGPARPQSKQAYDALPSGTQFMDPNGEIRVKP